MFQVFLLISLFLTFHTAWAGGEGAPILSSSSWIRINVPERKLRLIHEGDLVYEFPIAVGQNIYKTPIGSRSLSQIIWNPWWIPPKSDWAKNSVNTPPGKGNPLGPVKMNLGQAILLHGTNKEYTVGSLASHGCMRMLNEQAKELAWWIQSHFSDKSELSYLQEVASKSKQSFYVNLEVPLPVEITYDLFEIEKGFLKIHPDVYHRAKDRGGALMAWLGDKGINLDRVNEGVVQEVLALSKKETAVVSLSDLIRGKKHKKIEIAKNSNPL